jgi:hypothetical protein
MNVALAMTAACYGATVANHCEVTSLTKDQDGNVNGAHLKDNLTGDEWTIKAKVKGIFVLDPNDTYMYIYKHKRVLSMQPALSLMVFARWTIPRTLKL